MRGDKSQGEPKASAYPPPLDWDPIDETWICQMHGLRGCQQDQECIDATHAYAAAPDWHEANRDGLTLWPDGLLTESGREVLRLALDEWIEDQGEVAEDYRASAEFQSAQEIEAMRLRAEMIRKRI